METGAPPSTLPQGPDESGETDAPGSTDVPDSGDTAETEPEESKPYVCPTQLLEIMQKNSDAYAWLYVPGLGISYPVLQSNDNDRYYLTHSSENRYSVAGALFTEHVYNSRDLEDPVTIIYGHLMKSGAMFGALQGIYSIPENLKEFPVIEMYLSDRKLEYRVFAALPYDSRHILYNYDFTDSKIYRTFFRSITESRVLNASFAPEYYPAYGDHVLILSTCLRGDSTQRYLVMAKRVDS